MKTEISLQSKAPHTTWLIVVKAPMNNQPTELYGALEKIGFKKQPSSNVPMNKKQQISEKTFFKKGKGIFGTWDIEEQVFLKEEAKKTLAEFGFNDVPEVKLTWQDLI